MYPALDSAFEEHAAVFSRTRDICLESLQRLIGEAVGRTERDPDRYRPQEQPDHPLDAVEFA